MAPTDHLLRDLAPIPARAWKEIDDEARARLTPLLAARKLVDWVGTGGGGPGALSVGRPPAPIGSPAGGAAGGGGARAAVTSGPPPPLMVPPAGVPAEAVTARQRRVLPLSEVRVPFTVSRRE